MPAISRLEFGKKLMLNSAEDVSIEYTTVETSKVKIPSGIVIFPGVKLREVAHILKSFNSKDIQDCVSSEQ